MRLVKKPKGFSHLGFDTSQFWTLTIGRQNCPRNLG
jgi:hypothetical protein